VFESVQSWAVLLNLRDATGFDLGGIWSRMTYLRKEVVLVILFMALWTALVTLDRYLAFRAARTKSQLFAPVVAGALREGKLDEAIRLGDRYRKSHLAKVVVAGLEEYRAHGTDRETETRGAIEASRRALDRAKIIVNAELKRGLPGLERIAYTAPGVGLFGTALGIINVFGGVPGGMPAKLAAVAAGVSEALATTALGLLAALPALWMHSRFTKNLEDRDREMAFTSSELIDYLIKRTGVKPK
jgi:biopolymer transport protein ExbB